MPKVRKLKVGQKAVEIDVMVKIKAHVPSGMSDDDIEDAVYLLALAGADDARVKVMSCPEIVDMDVVNVKEG